MKAKRHHKSLYKAINRFCPDPKDGAEIGVFRGDTVKFIHKHFPQCRMILVDPWEDLEEYNKINRMKKKQVEWDGIFEEACYNIATSGGPSIVHRSTSRLVAQIIPDKSLDFVFLDANHTYESVKQDIELWEPKAKRLICGHDYGARRDKKGLWGVSRAVQERYGEHKVHTYKGTIWAVEL